MPLALFLIKKSHPPFLFSLRGIWFVLVGAPFDTKYYIRLQIYMYRYIVF